MIQEKDLRIGSYVHSIEFGLVKVYGISENIIQYKHEGDILYGEPIEFQPILLTEEILLKIKGLVHYHGRTFGIDLNDNNSYISVYFRDNDVDVSVQVLDEEYSEENTLELNIVYLHQLQNLYFALTDVELVINI